MERFNMRRAEMDQRLRGGVKKIAGFVVAAALLFATPGLAADWLAPAADQDVTAPWVNDITSQLEKDAYRDVFMNALGNSPQAVVVRYLNNAAQALQAGNKPLAQSYVDRTIDIFDKGVRQDYYSQADVEPIKKLIRTRAEAAIKGEAKMVTGTQPADRWTGYTHDKSLGLTNDVSRMTSEHPEAKK
jgi:hypothetical protein